MLADRALTFIMQKPFSKISSIKFLVKVELKANHLPPQQKPVAPMAKTPLLLRAAIIALASSYPLS